KPVTGFMLSAADLAKIGYVRPSEQQSPPSLAQEKRALEASMVAVDEQLALLAADEQDTITEALYREKVALKESFREELAILDAVKKYSPILYLHPDDLARPVDPRDFFAGETTAVREGSHSQVKR